MVGGGFPKFYMLTVIPYDRDKHGVSANGSMSDTRSGGAHYGQEAHCDLDLELVYRVKFANPAS